MKDLEELARNQYESCIRIHPEGSLWFPPDEMSSYLEYAEVEDKWPELTEMMRKRIDDARTVKYDGKHAHTLGS
jgi:hypothetical protein